MRIISILVSGVFILLFTGCVTLTPTPKGVLFTATKGPVYATANEKREKVGRSTAKSILGIIAFGDASTETAAANAGIKKIHHADYEDFLILGGLYCSYTVVVYGE